MDFFYTFLPFVALALFCQSMNNGLTNNKIFFKIHWIESRAIPDPSSLLCTSLLFHIAIYGKRSVRPLYLFASVRSHRVRSPINMFRTRVRSPSIIFAYHIFNTLYILFQRINKFYIYIIHISKN